jgi:hypothetical protein
MYSCCLEKKSSIHLKYIKKKKKKNEKRKNPPPKRRKEEEKEISPLQNEHKLLV